MSGQRHVRQLVETIDDNSWVIDSKLILTRQTSAGGDGEICSWSDGNGSFYVLSEAPHPIPPSRPLSSTSTVEQVQIGGQCTAAWRAGDAFMKARDMKPFELRSTREHVTLAALNQKEDLSFPVPKCLYHALWDSRYFMVSSVVPGEMIDTMWPTMDETERQHCVDRVVEICTELEKWEADYIGGVDKRELSDRLLNIVEGSEDYSHEKLVANCKELGMDCSTFKFYHCDLGPTNLVINTTDRSIGVIDWETAGFVPREWIRTRFHVWSGMDLKEPTGNEEYETYDWRVRVGRKLGSKGFPEVINAWAAWWEAEASD